MEPTTIETNRIQLPGGLVLLPPVSADELRKDTENDPEGAEAFVTLIRTLRQTDFRPVTV